MEILDSLNAKLKETTADLEKYQVEMPDLLKNKGNLVNQIRLHGEKRQSYEARLANLEADRANIKIQLDLFKRHLEQLHEDLDLKQNSIHHLSKLIIAAYLDFENYSKKVKDSVNDLHDSMQVDNWQQKTLDENQRLQHLFNELRKIREGRIAILEVEELCIVESIELEEAALIESQRKLKDMKIHLFEKDAVRNSAPKTAVRPNIKDPHQFQPNTVNPNSASSIPRGEGLKSHLPTTTTTTSTSTYSSAPREDSLASEIRTHTKTVIEEIRFMNAPNYFQSHHFRPNGTQQLANQMMVSPAKAERRAPAIVSMEDAFDIPEDDFCYDDVAEMDPESIGKEYIDFITNSRPQQTEVNADSMPQPWYLEFKRRRGDASEPPTTISHNQYQPSTSSRPPNRIFTYHPVQSKPTGKPNGTAANMPPAPEFRTGLELMSNANFCN